MKKIFIPALLAACAAPHGQALADTILPAPARVEATIGAEDSDAVGMLDLFVPLYGGKDQLLFTDIRLLAGGGDNGFTQGSIGFGYRHLLSNAWVLGINGYYDYLESDYDNTFGRVGIGIEALSRDWELRANAYLPVGSVNKAVEEYNAALVENNRLVFRAGLEEALRGFDAEVGYRLPVFSENDLSQIKAYVGGYWYEGDHVESVPGVSARVELSRAGLPGLGNGSRLTLIAGVNYDDQNDVSGTFLARLRVPLGDTSAQDPYDPMFDRVDRSDRIRTYAGTIGRAEAAVVAETGQVAGNVVAINANSSAENINSRIAAAGEGAVVVASGEIDLDRTLQLGTGSLLTSGGHSLVVSGALSGGTAIYRTAGGAGTLNGTNAAADVVSMGQNSTVTDISITGGRDGIVANGVGNVHIRNVGISGTSGNGIGTNGAGNVQIANVRMSNVAGSALAANGTNGLQVSNLQANGLGSGLALNGVDNAQFNTVGLAITGGGNAIQADGVTNLLVANMNVSGNVGSGILASNATNLQFSNVSIGGVSGSGIVLSNATNAVFGNVGIAAGAASLPVFRSFAFAMAPATGGILLDNVENVLFDNVTVGLDGGNGISVTGAENVQFSNVRFTGTIDQAFAAFDSSNVKVDNVSFARVTGDGLTLGNVDGASFQNVNLALSGGDAIVLDTVSNVQISNVGFTGSVGDGIVVHDADNVAVKNIAFADVAGAGLSIDAVKNASFDGIVLPLSGGVDGVTVNDVNNVRVANVELSGTFANGVSVDSANRLELDNIGIAGAAGTGILLSNASDVLVNGADISNAGGDGISATNVDNLQIANLKVAGAAGTGVIVTTGNNVSIDTAEISNVVGDGVSVTDVTDLQVANADISAAGEDGIRLVNVDNGLIASTKIHDLTICHDNTACEWSIFDPDVAPYAAISALDVNDLTISDVSVDNVTYGLFVGSRHVEVNWQLETPDPSQRLTIDGFNLTNSRREAMLLVNVEGADIRNVNIDNREMTRTMDLVVVQKSTDVTFDGMDLKGGINALMFAAAMNLPGETARMSVSNVSISETSNAGVFINPSSDFTFTNVEISGPGTYGYFFYGDSWGFMGGPVTNVTFDNVNVTDAGTSTVYVLGPIQDFNGNIGSSGSAPCTASAGPWSGTELIQNGGQVFSIGGAVVPIGNMTATCGL